MALAITFAVMMGISNGIEKVNKVMMPADHLFAVVFFVVVLFAGVRIVNYASNHCLRTLSSFSASSS
ncbi:hypothetical protein M3P05_12975 [Sansalvadorimonas sp. 2012CJ34-2]|uniref:Uncharacterized protein n=1 Tax=Parendozoicomonas callyspongiae TaxID=2942213 RepID=A0ABT0PIJ5_9GAMM|nr:hypothetical protein [Sansalvadorimonas sp. 2012CJ34-2]MCL6270836.1 hypothetical protein [Sansalvadorimonas sp. 2012CJ34-2]